MEERRRGRIDLHGLLGIWDKFLLLRNLSNHWSLTFFSKFRQNLDLNCQGEKALYPFDVMDCTSEIESGNNNKETKNETKKQFII